MNDNDMSNIINQLNNMMQNNEFPDNIKEAIGKFSASSYNSSSASQSATNTSNTTDSPDIDINTILKMKKIIDSMNANRDDPRSNLLKSLKPYLKESRQKKVDQYVQLFGLSKAFEMFGSMGGEDKHDI